MMMSAVNGFHMSPLIVTIAGNPRAFRLAPPIRPPSISAHGHQAVSIGGVHGAAVLDANLRRHLGPKALATSSGYGDHLIGLLVGSGRPVPMAQTGS